MSGPLIKVHCIKALHGNQFLLDNFSFHQVKRKRKVLYSRILSIIVFKYLFLHKSSKRKRIVKEKFTAQGNAFILPQIHECCTS